MDSLLLIGIALLALVAIGYLLAQLIRLRLEVWANQRVIAALEEAGHKPAAKKSRLPEMLAAVLLLLLFFQILSIFLNPM